MKKILQISKYYYPELGGIEKTAKSISDAVEGKYEMRVVCFSREKSNAVDIVDGVNVSRFGSIKVASQPLSLSICGKIRKELREYKPDFVIVHEPDPFLTFWVLKYISKEAKLITYWHSDIIKQKIGGRLLRSLYCKELKRADRIIATSPNYIEGSFYLSRFKNKCVVVPSCIDEKNLIPSDASHKMAMEIREKNKDKIICLGIGRVVPYKGFEYLAQVARLVDERFVFYVSGYPGSSTNRIEQTTKDLNNFTLLGATSDDVQKAYLEAADIFVFPSITKNEAFGLGLAEGMYFGKPAVTFYIKGSGVNFVNLKDVTGLEVDNRNVEKYAEALMRLADDENLRKKLGEAAKSRVEQNFLYKQYKDNILKVFENER
ncbi:glycosyltransferase [Butyrivibrio sp. AC2005]|uniref:glycosyltransferase n=1 Tax=Butyrivibrio sp. AC2005 TaxID=1280672 RepID=UPI000406A5F3|nr:glycosyltransferase [Butyrivibrio sp. AC2005]